MPTDPITTAPPQPAQQISNEDKNLRYLREIVAAIISLLFIVGFAVMIYFTYGYVTTGKEDVTFERAKDLLLIVNPFIGIVIGYYFNKVSTESRAENAEASARTAAVATKTAEADKENVQKEKENVALALTNLTAAADSVIDQAANVSLGVAGSEQPNDGVNRLRAANRRAKEVLGLQIREGENPGG